MAARSGRRVIVDAMSSLFGEPLDVTREGIDAVTASANKCLQGIPGVAFVLVRRKAVEALSGVPPRSIYLDLHAHYATQERDNTPFTPAVQVLHAMREAIRELEASQAAVDIFGADVVAHYLNAARVEQEQYDAIVHAWDRERYLERG